MFANPDIMEPLTVFWKLGARDRTDGIKTDLWHAVHISGTWRDSVESVTGDGTLAKTTVRKIHLVSDGFEQYPAATGWTVRPGDYVARGEYDTTSLTEIKAIANICSVMAVTENTHSGMKNGSGMMQLINNIYVEGE